jgi:hypothetical protein
MDGIHLGGELVVRYGMRLTGADFLLGFVGSPMGLLELQLPVVA